MTDDGSRFLIQSARSNAMNERREMIDVDYIVSVLRQCELLRVNRSSLYYVPVEPDQDDLQLMRRMDELHLTHCFFGSRMLTQKLKREGTAVNRKRIQRLMLAMGLESMAPKPDTSKPSPDHPLTSRHPCLRSGNFQGSSVG
jgi:putative transposase